MWHLQEREAEHEEKQMLLKKGKEKEVARLRALQERDRDHKADQVCLSPPGRAAINKGRIGRKCFSK
jgi:triphosphoribosyl-dephospho-CoA synthetase